MICTRCGDDRVAANLIHVGDDRLCPEHVYEDSVKAYQHQTLAPPAPAAYRASAPILALPPASKTDHGLVVQDIPIKRSRRR